MTLTFLITSLVVVATPGTGALLAISAGLSRGVRASLITAAGCTLGTVPHLVAAITGAAAVLQASGAAFQVVKVLGVGYLLYMAWTTWRDTSLLTARDDLPVRSAWRDVLTAVLANLLNPKLTLFFFAFLPQFVPPGDPNAVLRMTGLSTVFMAMTFVVFAAYGAFAAAARERLLSRPTVVNRLRQAFAVSFVGLGAKLATTSR